MLNVLARAYAVFSVLGGGAVPVNGLPPTLDRRLPTDDSDWQKYIRSPSSTTVRPSTILAGSVTGNVVNPNGLIDGSGPAQFIRSSSTDSPPTVVVDFGQNVVGLLNIDFAGAAAAPSGSPGIRLAFSETVEYLGDRSDFTRSDNADPGTPQKIVPSGTDQIAVQASPYTWTDVNGCQHGSQVCADGLHGFRYVKISLDALSADSPYTAAAGQVNISSVSLTWSGFLGTVDTFTGWFESSDEDLNQWWYDGVYTNDMCTDEFLANDTEPRQAFSTSLDGKLVLMDGAKRDRDPYVGDLAVSALTLYQSHDASSAVLNVLVDLAEHQRSDGWIPPASIRNYDLLLFDYPLWWVSCSYDYVMYTGNITYLQAYYSVLVKVLDEWYTSTTDNSTSLLYKGQLSNIDTSGYGDYAFLPRSGPITYYNALYVLGLNQAADLADIIAKSDDSSRWRARAQTVSASLSQHNFDAGAGAFYDGAQCSSTYCATHSQDGNGIAILAGVANTSTAESILAYLAETTAQPYGNSFFDNDVLSSGFSTRVYAFISYFDLAARLSTSNNTHDSAFEEIRRLYGWMSTHDPSSTFWEGIGPNGSAYEQGDTSMAHGWSTGIVPLMSRHVLGVVPTKPGFGEWSVKPVVDGGGLTWARGVVPTPSGGIRVEWIKDGPDGKLSLTISSPSGTAGTVGVPIDNAADNISVDGQVVYAGGSGTGISNGYYAVQVSGGNHTILVTGQ